MSDMTWDELVKAYGFPGEPLVECAEHEAVLVARKLDAERRAAESVVQAEVTTAQTEADATP